MSNLRDPALQQVDEADLTSFGDLLQRYRLAAGISQEALAERAGVSMQTISAIERGVTRNPQRKTALELVTALRLPPEKHAHLTAALKSTPLHRGDNAPTAVSGAVASIAQQTSGQTTLPALPVPMTHLRDRYL